MPVSYTHLDVYKRQLSYLIQNSPKPIVITGAQKPIDLEITDAKTNLLDSLRFASCSRAHGVNLVFDGKVIAGTRAKKERTKSYNAFSSINFPYVAVIHDDHIIFYLDDKDHVTGPAVFYHHLDSKVALLKLIPSMDAGVLDYMAEHYDAVIIESFGVGGIPARETGDFTSAIEDVYKRKISVCTDQYRSELPLYTSSARRLILFSPRRLVNIKSRKDEFFSQNAPISPRSKAVTAIIPCSLAAAVRSGKPLLERITLPP